MISNEKNYEERVTEAVQVILEHLRENFPEAGSMGQLLDILTHVMLVTFSQTITQNAEENNLSRAELMTLYNGIAVCVQETVEKNRKGFEAYIEETYPNLHESNADRGAGR